MPHWQVPPMSPGSLGPPHILLLGGWVAIWQAGARLTMLGTHRGHELWRKSGLGHPAHNCHAKQSVVTLTQAMADASTRHSPVLQRFSFPHPSMCLILTLQYLLKYYFLPPSLFKTPWKNTFQIQDSNSEHHLLNVPRARLYWQRGL